MALERWAKHTFSSGCYPGKDYLSFQRAARISLKKQATEAGYEIHDFYCPWNDIAKSLEWIRRARQ